MLTMTNATAAATQKVHIIRPLALPAKSPQPELSRNHPHAAEWPQGKRVNPHERGEAKTSGPDRSRERRAMSATTRSCPGPSRLRLFVDGTFMSMPDSELDVLHASVGIDHDGGGPASHAISSGYPLLRILHEAE